MFTFVVVFLPIFIFLGYHFYWKRKSLPPGPLPLPFIGNVLNINQYGLEKALSIFRKQYGDIYTLWFGNQPAVMLNTYDLIQEACLKNAEIFAGRPDNTQLNKVLRGGNYGIIMTDGDQWREHRRFTLHVLRNFGLGKNLMQERVLNEVAWLIKDLNDKIASGNDEIFIQDKLDVAVASIINSLIFGYTLHEENIDEFYQVKRFLREILNLGADPFFRVAIGDNTGILRKLPVFKPAYEKGQNLGKDIRKFFRSQIEARRAKIDLENNYEPTDYVEAYLMEQKKQADTGKNTDLYSDAQLFGCVFDVWLAGMETTSNTLAWMFVYLMTNPEIQKRLHEELDQVIGCDRLITVEDKMELPFVNCVIAETQRLCNLLPNNLPHRLTEDIEFRGYLLKANTTIFPQISAVFKDESVFPKHEEFNPDRFMDSKGKFHAIPELTPFSVGKRACLGESLARLELFLFGANLFNQFKVSCVEKSPPNLDRIDGVTIAPARYVTHFQRRY